MTRMYVTFGQAHKHIINGKTFDKDCVAIVRGSRENVFDTFGEKFCFCYPEVYWDEKKSKHFPRGYIEVDDE